jgi:hypothetical protein
MIEATHQIHTPDDGMESFSVDPTGGGSYPAVIL